MALSDHLPTASNSYKSMLEWVLKTVLVGISSFGVNQLKAISVETAKLNVSIAEIKTEIKFLNDRVFHLEGQAK